MNNNVFIHFLVNIVYKFYTSIIELIYSIMQSFIMSHLVFYSLVFSVYTIMHTVMQLFEICSKHYNNVNKLDIQNIRKHKVVFADASIIMRLKSHLIRKMLLILTSFQSLLNHHRHVFSFLPSSKPFETRVLEVLQLYCP